jgi:hypothetical protein
MKNYLLLLFAFFLTSSSMNAQFSYPAKTTDIDLAFSKGNGASTGISFVKLYGIGAKKKFKVGVGLRLTSFFGSNLDFITAPPDLSSKPETVDTIQFKKVQTNALNLGIHLQYSLRKLDIGFNIDVLGLTFGASQSGIVDAPNNLLDNTTQTAKLTAVNLLLVGDRDKGTLNSELYARYWLKPNIGLRAGASFQFLEYTTDNVIAYDNKRFRSKNLQPLLALTYRFN